MAEHRFSFIVVYMLSRQSFIVFNVNNNALRPFNHRTLTEMEMPTSPVQGSASLSSSMQI